MEPESIRIKELEMADPPQENLPNLKKDLPDQDHSEHRDVNAIENEILEVPNDSVDQKEGSDDEDMLEPEFMTYAEEISAQEHVFIDLLKLARVVILFLAVFFLKTHIQNLDDSDIPDFFEEFAVQFIQYCIFGYYALNFALSIIDKVMILPRFLALFTRANDVLMKRVILDLTLQFCLFIFVYFKSNSKGRSSVARALAAEFFWPFLLNLLDYICSFSRILCKYCWTFRMVSLGMSCEILFEVQMVNVLLALNKN